MIKNFIMMFLPEYMSMIKKVEILSRADAIRKYKEYDSLYGKSAIYIFRSIMMRAGLYKYRFTIFEKVHRVLWGGCGRCAEQST